MTIDQKILGMTTLIECSSTTYNYTSQGSGFFYAELEKEDTKAKGPRWRKVESVWLITNRHVAFPCVKQADGSMLETIPDSFVFHMREVINGKIEWVPIQLTKDDILSRTKLHTDSQVDVVAIQINDLQIKTIRENPDKTFIGGLQLTSDNFPSSTQPSIEVTSDIVVCSYPYGFYDEVNKFPIVKSGVIASYWGANFNGSQHFLIDAKLFPGSSGGLVISKPTNVAMIGGQLMHSKEKQYMFLGIYSGEYSYDTRDNAGHINSESFGLGIVWYSHLVPQIINNGIQYKI